MALQMVAANTIKLSGSDNFLAWKKQVKNLLTINDLWDYVTGAICKPGPTPDPAHPGQLLPPDAAALSAFDRADRVPLAFLHLACEENVDSNIEAATTSAEAWATICSLYERKDQARALILKAQLYSIPYAGSVAEHLTQVKAIVNQLNTLGSPASDSELVTSIIKSLPSDFHALISTLSVTQRLATMDLNTLEGLLLQEESLLHMTASSGPSSSALAAKQKGHYQQRQSVTRQFGSMNLGQSSQPHRQQHQRNTQPPQRNSQQTRSLVCHYCGKPGHIAPDCFKKQRDMGQQPSTSGNRGRQTKLGSCLFLLLRASLCGVLYFT